MGAEVGPPVPPAEVPIDVNLDFNMDLDAGIDDDFILNAEAVEMASEDESSEEEDDEDQPVRHHVFPAFVLVISFAVCSACYTAKRRQSCAWQ